MTEEFSIKELAQMNRRELMVFATKNKVQITQSLTEPLISQSGIRKRIYEVLKARGYAVKEERV